MRHTKAARLRVIRLEERALPVGNLALSSAILVDASGTAMPQAITGQNLYIRTQWTSTGLTASDSYLLRFAMDGVSVDSNPVTAQAGNGLIYITTRQGFYASPGSHTITVTLDANNSVAETLETDNSISFSFTPMLPTNLASKFLFPIGKTMDLDWQIGNYADVDPRANVTVDYRGGTFAYGGHNAIDAGPANFQAMDAGIPVYAAADGVVSQMVDGNFDRETTNNPNATSNYLLIDHPNQWQTIYAHFATNTITVKVGDTVKAGQLLGMIGSSGDASGPHLHWTPYYRGVEVETGYAPSTYFVSPPIYSGDRSPLYVASGITNYSPGSDLSEGVSAIDTFSTSTSNTVSAWQRFTFLRTTDVVQARWLRPNGTLYATSNFSASNFLLNATITFGLPSAAWNTALGTWQVAVTLNGVEVSRNNFTVTSGAGVPSARLTFTSGAILINGRTTPINFGSVAQGGSAIQQSYTLNNHGSAPLTISNWTLPPGFTGVSLPSSIAANSSATVTLQLDSAAVGSKFSAVQFSTNDPDTPTYWFNVSGSVTGVAPAGAPVLTLPDAALANYFQTGAHALAPNATVADANSLNFNAGQLRVEFASGGDGTDRLAIANLGSGAGQIGVSGSTVTFAGLAIGTFSGGSGTAPLIVALNVNASVPATQALVRAIAYQNVGPSIAYARRTVRFTLQDGTGNTSNLALAYVAQGGRNALVARVAGAQVNGSADPQRSRVTSLVVAFDSIVSYAGSAAAAYTLVRDGSVTVPVNVASSNASGATISTITFAGGTEFGSLLDGLYTLTLAASNVTTASGLALDGDANGVAGGNYSLGFFRLYGDGNGDANVDLADIDLFSNAFGASLGDSNYSAAMDFEGDGSIDLSDIDAFSSRFGLSI